MNRPLVVLTVSYTAGILIGGFAVIKASTALALAAFCFLAALVWYVRGWRGGRLVIVVLFVLTGLAASRLWLAGSETALLDYEGRRVTVTGWVAAEPDVREDRVFYLVKAREVSAGGERREVSGTVRLVEKDPEQVHGYGDMLRATGLISRPASSGNPGLFDYRTYLERQGIKVTLFCRGRGAVERTGEYSANPLLKAVLTLKQRLAAGAAAGLPPAWARIVNGIVFGIQGPIDRDTRRAFSETGLVHILSVSGLHVGLVLGGLICVLNLLKASPGLTAPAATPVLAAYAFMTGMSPAVVRAAFMALLLLWARHLGRDRDWAASMAAAALAILLWNPLQIYHPGFQLSFAATWGILYPGPVLASVFESFMSGFPPRAARTISVMLAVPLSAQLATVPLVAWYYNFVSPVSVAANLLALPLVSLVMFLGIAAALLGLVWLPLAGLVNAGTGAVMSVFLPMVDFFQGLPGAVIYLKSPPVALAAAWYGLLLAAVHLRGCSREVRQRVLSWTATGVLFGAVLVLILFPWKGSHKLTVHFIDVGQGDSALIQTPGGWNVLIDAGGWGNETDTGSGAGDQVVAPYLRKAGVRKIDVLVLTHPHEDHCGGASFLIGSFPVALAVVSPLTEAPGGGKGPASGGNGGEIPAGYAVLLEKMAAAGIPVAAAAAGDVIRLENGLRMEVLSPERTAGGSGAAVNDNSLVCRLAYGRRSFLFAGDIEKEAQEELVQRETDLKADVLKVPHHGSRSIVPELLELVKPEAAVISVGEHNSFGHPAPSTVELLEEVGAGIYRTDLDGAVIVETDGNTLEIRTGKRN